MRSWCWCGCRRGDGVQTSPGIAATTGIPEPTVAKVLKTLAASGLVASQRGAHGGYRLLRPLAAIPIADVIAAIDGPIALTACVDGSRSAVAKSRACLPDARPLGPGERRHPAGAVGITLADMQEASIPRAFRMPPRLPLTSTPPNRERKDASRRRNPRHRPVRHPVRLQMGLRDRRSRWTSRPRG